MKKIFTFLFLLAFANAYSQSSTVVISQVYGGGGSAAGTFKSDYVELHNLSTTAQDISGFKIIYGSSTGNLGTGTSIFTFPISPAVIIPAGGYVLVANAAGAGIANLTPVADYTFTLAMSGTTGKIAFGNGALVGGTTYAVQLATGNVIDFVGYGTANESETSPTAVLSATTAAVRKTNGCTETNNNNTDFNVVAVTSPRNSASPVSLCTSPTITAASNITNMTTTSGVASVSQSFNLSASNLTPAAGNLTITPTMGLEISFNNTTFFAPAQTLAYTGAALASTPIYVRIAAGAAQGALTGANVTTTGGGATAAVITVAGGVYKNYYSNAVGNLNVASTWGDNTAGTVNPPADFTVPYAIFNIVNRTVTSLGGPLDFSGVGSKIVIGDGITAGVIVETNTTDTIKATNTVDIKDGSDLNIGNKVAPIFGSLGIASTVYYSYNGPDSININTANYANLILLNGKKNFSPGVTTINENLDMNGTLKVNGGPSPFSAVILKGNINMYNNAKMEDSTTGFQNRLSLFMAGTGVQTINTGTGELNIFRLQRDTVAGSGDLNINVTPGSKITIGNVSGGDLKLLQKISGTPTFTTMTMGADAQLAIVKNGSIFTDANGKAGNLSTTDSKIIINKSTTSATIVPGTLKFVTGSSLKELTVNITTPTKDTLGIANNILIKNNLNLTKGVVLMAANQTLELANTAVVNGASTISFIDGKVAKSLGADEIFLFPVGQKTFSPVEIKSAFANDFNVKYNKQAYSNTAVNSTTTTAIPTYHVSATEHWDITPATMSSADVKFYYNNPVSGVLNPMVASIAHFNGTNWDDIGRTTNATDANGTYISKNGITSFSPFTFGGANGILPIILENFTGSLNNNTATLSWRTGCEDAGDIFELEYSTNGTSFTNIYNTNALGNCNGNIYKYIHTNANANANYYRLKMIATTGRVTYSNVVILKNGKNNFETKIVSTNNNALLGLSITSPISGKGVLQIVNTQGQRIYNQTIIYSNGYQINYINTAKWSTGLYFVNFTNENGIKSTLTYVR